MKKAQTMVVGHDGKKKINEGDLVIAIQGNKDGEEMMVNMDWSFYEGATPSEIKSMIGCFLASVEDLFGEKMVTESITHYAGDTGKILEKFDDNTIGVRFRSKGLDSF